MVCDRASVYHQWFATLPPYTINGLRFHKLGWFTMKNCGGDSISSVGSCTVYKLYNQCTERFAAIYFRECVMVVKIAKI